MDAIISKKEAIWSMLLSGQRLTPQSVSRWCMSLSQRIGNLKREKKQWLWENGMYIASSQKNNCGYSTYWLEKLQCNLFNQNQQQLSTIPTAGVNGK